MRRFLIVACALLLSGCAGIMGGEDTTLGDGKIGNIPLSTIITVLSATQGGGGAGALAGLLGGGLGGIPATAPTGPQSLAPLAAWLCGGITVAEATEFGEDRRQRLCADLVGEKE